ncbi:MAG: putative DNA binding domain-containing protein [Bacteroidetes bacterium]|nr:putative DNA binding domain-containing protein [Bacteroidota bacterium]
MTREQITQLITSGESDRIERTVSISNTVKFSEAVCAFANDFPNHKQPGYLLIGVKDDGTLSGLKVTDELLKNLGALRSEGNILPPPVIHIEKFSYQEGEMAVVEVQPSFFPPVRYKGKVWLRIGPRKSVANEAEERILIERRQAGITTFDSCPLSGATLNDLDLELFKYQYLPKAVDDDTLNRDTRDVSEKMASLRLFDTTVNSPTVAGILLLGKNPEFFLPGAYVQYVRFGGTGREANILREVKFSANLITMLNKLDGFVDNSLVEKKPVPVSVLREEQVLNYPYWALRELIMNAVMHRDYQSNMPIRLYQFDDRIEIMNAGGLYGNARPENFPNVNDYRNPVIAETMKVLGYVNRFSRGVSRVNEELQDNDNGKAIFNFDLITVFEVTVKSSKEYLKITDPVTPQVTLQVTPQVTPQVDDLIKCIKLGESYSRDELQDILELKDRENFRLNYLKPALEQGLIEMTIPDKPNSRLQRYRLTKKGVKSRK